MRRLIPALLLLAAAAAAQEDRARRFIEQERKAFQHFEKEEWAEAIAAFEAQIAVFADNPRPYYNIACAYARQGNAPRAVTWLRLAVQRGWRDAEHLAQDTDFDAVRQTDAFKTCVDFLAQARRSDPDPLPRAVAPESTASAPSVGIILATSFLDERALRNAEPLLGSHEYRKRLFRIYDLRMARLARYIAENGDARDADEAARARVDTATRYLEAATGESKADRALGRTGAGYVLVTSAEFLRGYPGSPLLTHVLLLRAHALRRLGRYTAAEDALRTLVADHPDDSNAMRARIQLCMLLADRGRVDDLRPVFKALRSEADVNPSVAQALRQPEMLRPRLLAEGLPEQLVTKLIPDPGYEGAYVFVFVSTGSLACERRLATLRKTAAPGRRFVVACVDPSGLVTDERRTQWLTKHSLGGDIVQDASFAIRALGLSTVPTVILARATGEVLAVNPTDNELAGGGVGPSR